MKFIKVTSCESGFDGQIYWLNTVNIYSIAAIDGKTRILMNANYPWNSIDHLVKEPVEQIMQQIEELKK